MPSPFRIELRERAVSAYEGGDESHTAVAARSDLKSVDVTALGHSAPRNRQRRAPAPRRRRKSPVDVELLEQIVRAARDATTEELTREYNRRHVRAPAITVYARDASVQHGASPGHPGAEDAAELARSPGHRPNTGGVVRCQ
jgi:hypothetical protein